MNSEVIKNFKLSLKETITEAKNIEPRGRGRKSSKKTAPTKAKTRHHIFTCRNCGTNLSFPAYANYSLNERAEENLSLHLMICTEYHGSTSTAPTEEPAHAI